MAFRHALAPVQGMDATGHTPQDLAALTMQGRDPATSQPREHPVPCLVCRRPTWHLRARCDQHYEAPRHRAS